MVSFNFWQKWLLAVCSIIVVFGLVIALLSWSPLFVVFNSLVNDVFWSGAGPEGLTQNSGPDQSTQQFILWAYGMLGATMAGWGLTLVFVVNNSFRKKEKWSRDAIAAGVILWFIVDTFMSVYTGAYFNVGVNVLVLALAGLPLLMTLKEFK